MITKLKKNNIFIFGSNLAGIHAGGAAKQALDSFGAIQGQGEGLQGQSYAFPTLTAKMKKVSQADLKASKDKLFKCCAEHPDKVFLLTKVGCGIAGFSEEQIKPLFIYDTPNNLTLPKGWNRRLFKFLNDGLKSAHGDCVWEIGKWKKSKSKNIKCCEAGGFHASTRIIDALNFVKGVSVAEVEVAGRSHTEKDKQCWSEMRLVELKPWTKIQSVTLAIFAADQVIDIFEKKHPTDDRPRKAIEAAKAYLKNPAALASAYADAAYVAAYVAAYAAATAAAAAAAAAAADAAYAAAAYAAYAAAAYAAADAADAAAADDDAADAGKTLDKIEKYLRADIFKLL